MDIIMPKQHLLLVGLALLMAGCGRPAGQPDLVWGRRGVRDGDFVKPRAIAIDGQDRIFVVDFTARIQAFDRAGQHLGHTWTPPDYRIGRPSGLSIDREGNLLVSDSHYQCLRIYSSEGKLLRTIGADGQFDYISDAVQAADGSYFVAEFGSHERITKLSPAGQVLKRWGSLGTELGQFSRIRALALGPDGLLYAADACNHRIQVFDGDGNLVRHWGSVGVEPGEMRFPYDLAFSPSGHLYVMEYGNHRVQKFTAEGKSLGVWGAPGHQPGQLYHPWALAVDSRGMVHAVDSENHRVQRIGF